MKKLLIGLLVLGSMNSFSSEITIKRITKENLLSYNLKLGGDNSDCFSDVDDHSYIKIETKNKEKYTFNISASEFYCRDNGSVARKTAKKIMDNIDSIANGDISIEAKGCSTLVGTFNYDESNKIASEISFKKIAVACP